MAYINKINVGSTLYDVQDLEASTAIQQIREMISGVESSPAASAHAAGSYLIYNGTLYAVKADIAVGDTLSVGTNIAAVPDGICGLVADLNDALGVVSESLAPAEETATASQAYAAGDLLMYNNRLYRAVGAIASGETLTPGTNIVPDTVSGEIDDIKANVASAQNQLSVKTTSPFEAFFGQYMSMSGTMLSGQVVQNLNRVSGTFTSGSSSPYIVVLSNTTRGYSGTLGNYTPQDTDLIPIGIFGGANRIELSAFLHHNTLDTPPELRFHILPVIKDGDTITKLPTTRFSIQSNALTTDIQSLSEDAANATHAVILLYFTRRTNDFSFDLTYEFRPAPTTA